MTQQIARLQSAVTLTSVAFFGALAYALWPQRPVLAALCLAGSWLTTAVIVALQFVMLYAVNTQDPAPRASVLTHVRAWAGEVWVCWQVFHWRQPFRSQAVPDHVPSSAQGQRGVVFIHGFFCNRGLWTPWLARLEHEGRAFVAVSLEPAFGSIDQYVETIERAVQQVQQATGLPPLLVCHSMGGLAVRAWLRARGSAARVHRVVTLGTPHQGTWLAHFSHTPNGAQMRRCSPWLQALAAHEAQAGTSELAIHRKFVCFYSNCDNIVFPVTNGTLQNADNRLYSGAGHLALAFTPQVQAQVWQLMNDS